MACKTKKSINFTNVQGTKKNYHPSNLKKRRPEKFRKIELGLFNTMPT